jgi:hypothetical protein
MRTADMVKSKFYSARDVKGVPPLVLTIADVTEELMGRGQGRNEAKCFLWFNETLKGLQLNKTRVAILEMAYGPDSTLWVGKRVRLSFDPTVIFGGQAVGGVRLQTSPGVVFDQMQTAAGAWGAAAAPQSVPGRPPQPVWDDKRQMWITPQAPTAAPARPRPPPPVFNEATGEWETVNPQTGEIAPPRHVSPPTIKERIDAGHPPAAADSGGDWGALPPSTGQPTEDWNDDIPF